MVIVFLFFLLPYPVNSRNNTARRSLTKSSSDLNRTSSSLPPRRRGRPPNIEPSRLSMPNTNRSAIVVDSTRLSDPTHASLAFILSGFPSSYLCLEILLLRHITDVTHYSPPPIPPSDLRILPPFHVISNLIPTLLLISHAAGLQEPVSYIAYPTSSLTLIPLCLLCLTVTKLTLPFFIAFIIYGPSVDLGEPVVLRG